MRRSKSYAKIDTMMADGLVTEVERNHSPLGNVVLQAVVHMKRCLS